MSHLYGFPRREMKARAKAALAGNWKTPLLMTLIYGILTMATTGVYTYTQGNIMESINMWQNMGDMSFNEIMIQQAELDAQAQNGVAGGLSTLIYFILNLFLAGSYALAMAKWYLERVQGMEVGFNDFLGNFAHALKGIGLYIWQQIWLFLWTLPFTIGLVISLFFVGMFSWTYGSEDQSLLFAGIIFVAIFVLATLFVGIYKSLCYLFIFQAGADAPKNIGIRRALRISIEATNGYRGDVFLLILSFIPWFILCVFTFGLAAFYVMPYYYATLSEAYVFLRDAGFDRDRFAPEEFGMTKVMPQEDAPILSEAPVMAEEPMVVEEVPVVDETSPVIPDGDETIYLHEGIDVGETDER